MFVALVTLAVLLVLSWGMVARLYLTRRELIRALPPVLETLGRHQAIEANSAELLRKETKRAEEYFGLLQGFEAERNQWKRLYYAEAMMHGNAQQLLLAELQSLQQQYRRATGKAPRVNAVVDSLTQEYSQTHPTPNPPTEAKGPEPTPPTTEGLEPEAQPG